ncbi:MAG: hypothetical protein ACRDID_10380 [Ktedonobacterales bacterium]
MSNAPLFTPVQLEALAKVIARELTASDIHQRLRDAVIPQSADNTAQTKWIALSEALQACQDGNGDSSAILRFVGLVMQSVYLSGSDEQRDSLCAKLNRVLFDAGYVLQSDGTSSRMLPNF